MCADFWVLFKYYIHIWENCIIDDMNGLLWIPMQLLKLKKNQWDIWNQWYRQKRFRSSTVKWS